MHLPQVARLEPKFQQQASLESKHSVDDELTAVEQTRLDEGVDYFSAQGAYDQAVRQGLIG
jgi:hypothetical protein